jgi:hypothetical protein
MARTLIKIPFRNLPGRGEGEYRLSGAAVIVIVTDDIVLSQIWACLDFDKP